MKSINEQSDKVKVTGSSQAKQKGYSLLRIVIQIVFLFLLPALFAAAFSGLMEIGYLLLNPRRSWQEVWLNLIPFLLVGLVSLLWGRLFCGWLCAFGSVTDWLNQLFSFLPFRKLTLTAKADRYLKKSKYFILAALFLLAVLAPQLSLSFLSPWDAFALLFTPGKAPDFTTVFSSLIPGFIFLVFILFASLWIERFFCRYLCPYGGFLALISKISPTALAKPTQHCGACKLCQKKCATQIPLSKREEVRGGECILCLRCLHNCPRKNIELRVFGKRIQPVLWIIMGILVLAGSYYLLTYQFSPKTSVSDTPASITPTSEAMKISEKTVPETTFSESQSQGNTAAATIPSTASEATTSETNSGLLTGTYKDGVYEGSGTGFRRGTTVIQVTVTSGAISDITVVSHQDDEPYFSRAFAQIKEQIIDSQNLEADIVSRATYSSQGILEAIENALAEAKA